MPPATIAKKSDHYDETHYDMPRMTQGRSVLWYPDRHQEDCFVGIVTKADDRTLDIAVIVPESCTFYIKTGVRHRNDPDGEMIDRSGTGVWDFCEDGTDPSLLVEMAKAMRTLSERVERLEKK